jgi:hypothetical protein
VQGAVANGTPALEWRFRLSDGDRRQQFAAMGTTLDARLQTRDRLQLRVTSDRPRRLWAQLRAPGGRDGERWGKTFYVDETLRPIELRFADFQPLGVVSSARPDFDRVDSLLLVIDTLNSRPGAAGVIEIADLALAR